MNPTIVERHPPQADDYADRNLALLERLIDLQIADPDRYASIPEGATVVIIPSGDAEFFRHNLNLAIRAMLAGGEVVLLPEEGLGDPDAWFVVSHPADQPGRVKLAVTLDDTLLRREGPGQLDSLLRLIFAASGREHLAG
jgi:hypothetical protein